MFRFSRPAPWLRQLFTPQTTSQPNPDQISGDVSLIQPYDGGGFALWDPGQWIVTQTGAAGASGTVTLVDLPVGEIMRILALEVLITAGAVARCRAAFVAPSGGEVTVSPDFTTPGTGLRFNIPIGSPICPPDHNFTAAWSGGDGATVPVFSAIICRVPIGSVFYV